jgi:hypothetical protein
VGGTIFDTATVSGGNSPTGTVLFTLFPPSDPGCVVVGKPLFTSRVPLGGDGGTVSDNFTVLTTGTYTWQAVYSGDRNNHSIATSCASGRVTIAKASPTLTTTPSPAVGPGGDVSDAASVTGGFNPGGSVHFVLYGPSSPNCTGKSISSSTGNLKGGNASSSSVLVTTPGTYNWVATYSGDINNTTETSACGAESVTVSATPTLTTTASAAVDLGGSVSDTATLSGGNNPTGTITFNLFGPGNGTCSGASIFTAPATVNGNGNYSSGPYTPTAAGTYNWTATYSGDANNQVANDGCGAPNESVVVSKSQTVLTTDSSGGVPLGSAIDDVANLSGGTNPTGTITFYAYGPNNATCTGTPAFTSTVTVNRGNDSYVSPLFTPTSAGAYQFVATYSGDANNAPAGPGSCTDPDEFVPVTQISPTISTTAAGGGAPGSPITDTATLSGGDAPTGTITFSGFGPDNATCTGTPVFTSTVTVNDGNGSYPSSTFSPTAAGTYQFVAAYSGDANNAPVVSACGDPNETAIVDTVAPTIATSASGGGAFGSTIADSATIAGGNAPSGTITFNVFGPNDATCTSPPAFTRTVAVNAGNGTYSSGPFTPTVAGTYQFVASYSGDANNVAAVSACGATNESVTVASPVPMISVTKVASPTSLPAGGGNFTFTVTITNTSTSDPVTIFDINDDKDNPALYEGCGYLVGTSLAPGAQTSCSFSYLIIDANAGFSQTDTVTVTAVDSNQSSTSASGQATVSITKASPAISTTAAGSMSAGTKDTATISGGYDERGTITFLAYGPNSATCTGTPAYTSSAVSVEGNGSYSSPTFYPTSQGIYDWVANYSGDTNNNAISEPCGASGETVLIGKASPAIATSNSGTIPAGGVSTDTATLTGGANPGGSITFTAFAPGSPTCSGTPAFTSTVPVTGNGTYTSAGYTVGAAGTYNWVASYGGDTSNNGALSACGLEPFTVTPQVLTGESYAVGVYGSLLHIPLVDPSYLQQVGPIATSETTKTPNPCLANASLPGLVFSGDVCASVSTVSYPGKSTAAASVANVAVGVGTLPIVEIQGVSATSITTCSGSTGSVTIAYLKVGNQVIISKATVIPTNDIITVGPITLILNQETPFSDGAGDTGLTVNAVNLSVNGRPVGQLNLILASAESDIGNCPGSGDSSST